MILGGLTSVLQLLQVSTNRPFKDNVQQLYTEWVAKGNRDVHNPSWANKKAVHRHAVLMDTRGMQRDSIRVQPPQLKKDGNFQ